MNYDWLGMAMFAGALLLLSLGYPVAFSLGGVAILFALIGSALGEFSFAFFNAMPSRIFDCRGFVSCFNGGSGSYGSSHGFNFFADYVALWL